MTHPVLSRPAEWLVVLFLLAGCSSTVGRGPVDPSAYAAMDCIELNDQVAKTAGALSQTAINRGKVTQTDIPAWLPGGRRVATAVTDRQTARIERLQEQQGAVTTARDRSCARRQ